jgi:chaperonin cofactor prefoldin
LAADRRNYLQRAALTLGEVEALPAGTITYKSVGKMFLQFPADKLVAEYHEEAAKREQQIQELSAKRGGAQAGIGAAEQKLREFLEKANQPGAGGNALESVSEE